MALKTFLMAKAMYEKALEKAAEDFQKELQELIPAGHALYWTQGTPSFNDGDPCEFNVNDITLVKLAEGVNIEDAGTDYEPEACLGEPVGDWPTWTKDLEKLLQCEELMESAFGNNVRVVLTRDAVDIEDSGDY